jgi:hypothetical protein
MSGVRVIGLTGPAGVGKSTVAQAVPRLDAIGPVWLISFGLPMKAMLAGFYATAGLTPEQIDQRLHGPAKELRDPLLGEGTPRRALQTLGTEWGRDLISPALWVGHWQARARLALDASALVIADDLRFENEALAVRALGGIVVEVEREGVSRSGAHVSESGVSPDAVLLNDGAPEAAACRLMEMAGVGP